MTDQTNPSPAAVTPAMLQAGNAVTLGDRDSGPITLTWDELTRIYCAMRAAALAPVATERPGDWNSDATLTVTQDGDHVRVSVHNGKDGTATIEFGHKGRSPRTRAALLALAESMQADATPAPAVQAWSDPEDDPPACEPSDFVPPPRADGLTGVAALAPDGWGTTRALGGLMLSLERWKASTSQTAEPAWRRLVAACAAMVAADAADAAAAPVAPSEPLTRFCPGCGSVGPVPDTYRDCCPDGSDARMIPERLAGKCRNLFLLALDAAAPVAPQAAPDDDEFTVTAREALAWVLWHHLGGCSPIGQPIRFALGMGQHERMSELQIEGAKRWAKATGSTTEEFKKAEAAPVAQPLTPAQMCAGDLVAALMSIVSDGAPWGNRAASMASTARAALAKVAAAGQGQEGAAK
ncbi:MAG: hypothetical protein RIQ53_4014 [Pseudomonadota bacterium]|jgi:hypothetical protein